MSDPAVVVVVEPSPVASVVVSVAPPVAGVVVGDGVSSVNGKLGAVTLAASDVGADPAGSAGAAQAAAEAASLPADTLGVASGAAMLGTDGTVGGPGGSALSDVTATNVHVLRATTPGIYGDTQRTTDATVSVGDLTHAASTSHVFTTADIGKSIFIAGAGSAGDLLTTISGVSAGQATLTTAASTAVTGAELIWGHDDSAGLQAVIDMLASAGGGEVVIPPGPGGGGYLLNGTTAGGAISWAVSVVSDNVTLRQIGGSVLYRTQPSGAGIFVTGGGKPNGATNWSTHRNIDATIYNISPVTAGDTTVTTTTPSDASHFTVGDYLYLATGDPAGSPSTAWYGMDAETFCVTSVNAATGVIGLNRPAAKDYAQEYWPTSAENSATSTTPSSWPAPFGIAVITDRIIHNIKLIDLHVEGRSLDRNFISSWQVDDIQLIRPRGRGYTGLSTGRDRIGYRCIEANYRIIGAAATTQMGYFDCWASGDVNWREIDCEWTSDNFAGYLHAHEGGVNCRAINPSFLNASSTAPSNGSGACVDLVGRWYDCRIVNPTFGACQYGVHTDASMGIGGVGTRANGHLIIESPRHLVAPAVSSVTSTTGVIARDPDPLYGALNLGGSLAAGASRGRTEVLALECDMAYNTGSRTLDTLPTNARILDIMVVVYSQFDGAASLQLGIGGDTGRYMGNLAIPTTAPSAQGTPICGIMAGIAPPAPTGTSPGVFVPSRQNVLATLTQGGASKGKLTIIILYKVGGVPS